MDNASSSDNHAESPRSTPSGKASGSGLTLVLPSLKAIKKNAEIKKPPRPVKLKPLKEVLTKLIAQIKKKDDYAFFLKPVAAANVPGYADVVKRPMDFGTMTQKVNRGKYRSLEEFTTDLRLVTNNAKIFNPPGSIYYTEADRIEIWALDHIQKAAPTVIEYETDWNIEIEQDEDTPLNIEEDDNTVATPIDLDESRRVRSTSVASVQPTRRAAAVAAAAATASASTPARSTNYKKPNTVSESIDAEGHLPGSKDGIGAFPPGSDWAKTMLALKLRGKRYRTKKERLRMERGGPPYAADGSLDYSEMEDPFSVLSALVPEPETRPYLEPLYPSLPPSDPSQTPFPAPINNPLKREIPSYINSSTNPAPKKRRHWYIVRNVTNRKGKDKDDEETIPAWQMPREAHTVDFGSYATLVGRLAEEIRARDVSQSLGSEELLFDAIRSSVETDETKSEDPAIPEAQPEYWTPQRAALATQYLRDIVYGGVDGFAYVRSLAEFMKYPKSAPEGDSYSTLGMPLSKWVEQSLIDPVTDGRHNLLKEIAEHLLLAHTPSSNPSISSQITRSRQTYPRIFQQLWQLTQISSHQIDMATLIHTPNELFVSENEWVGAAYKKELEEQKEKELTNNAAEYLAFAIQSHQQAQAPVDSAIDGPEVLQYVLNFTADKIMELHAKKKGDTKEDGKKTDGEDPVTRKLRLNLLALAKRAPLDKIARLPADLVPAHIRHFVPTLTS